MNCVIASPPRQTVNEALLMIRRKTLVIGLLALAMLAAVIWTQRLLILQ